MAVISGTTGNDYIISDRNESHDFLGGLGNDTLIGGAFSDTLLGGDGNDVISGRDGDDLIDGGVVSTGFDILYGGGGNDRFELNFGNMLYFDPTGGIIYGGSGWDVLFVDSPISTGILSDLSGWSTVSVENLLLMYNQPLWVTAAFLNSFETISVVSGGGSSDVGLHLKSPGSVDIVLVEGFVSFSGSQGSDQISVATNDNTILKLYGIEGNDELVGGEGSDIVYGGTGRDTINGGAGDDQIEGESGSDTYIYNYGDGWDDLSDSGPLMASESVPLEADRIVFGYGISLSDLSISKVGNLRILVGSEGGILIRNFSGFGFIEELYFENGDVVDMMEYYYLASNNRDYIFGFDTSEKISGLGGDDELSGAGGNDTIKGGAGFDWLTGDDGDDVIDGGMDDDAMHGGDGNDIFIVDSSGDRVTESSGQGIDYVKSSISYTLGDYIENLTLIGSASRTGRGNSLENVMTGNATSNVLWGDTGNDRLSGVVGNDKLFGEGGDDVLFGGDDHDQLVGGIGNDFLRSGSGGDEAYGGVGNDTVDGESGNDLLFGDGGRDVIKAGTGADNLIGGTGGDFLYGGTDAVGDVFDFNSRMETAVGSQRDVIHNFTSGSDDIDLSTIDARESTAGNEAFQFKGTIAAAFSVWYSKSGGNVIVKADVSGDRVADFEILVMGVGSLSSGDFIL